jgi:competence protein ComEC
MRLPGTPPSEQLRLPIREAHLQFEVERILQAENIFSKTSGIGRIVEASSTSRLEKGSRIYFRFKPPNDFKIRRGQELYATGILESIPHDVSPDSFEGYLKDTGVHYRFYRSSGMTEIQPPSRFENFCQEMNGRFVEYLSLGAEDDSTLKNIYIAMLLGQKAELSKSQKDRFRMTGTMHFFAISGLHIGVIATVIAQFLLLIRVPRRMSPIIGLPLLYLYVEVTGASPSAVRAFLMAAFFWAGFAFVRQRSSLAALSASAVFVLIFKPDQLWSIGFQLSYTVVLSILLFGLPLYEKLSERFSPFAYLPKNSWAPSQHVYAWVQDKLFLLFTISFSAWLASAPLSAGFFGYISPGAVFLNMLLVNLAALAISTGVIALTFAIIGLEFVTAFLNHGAWITIHCMDAAVIGSLKIPGMIISCDRFPEWVSYATLLVYLILLFLINRMRSYMSGLFWLLPPAIVSAAVLFGLALQ